MQVVGHETPPKELKMPDALHEDSAQERFLERLARLEKALLLPAPSDLEEEGILRLMGFAIDAGWKAMRRHLELSGQAPDSPTPPAAIAAAWRIHMIFNGENWMEMLARRSSLVRDDSKETRAAVMEALRTRFFPELAGLRVWLMRHPPAPPEPAAKKQPLPLDGKRALGQAFSHGVTS